MAVNYIKLWKLLLGKNMKKVEMEELAGISNGTLATLGKMSMYQWNVLKGFANH